jgi:hypothetical protein
VHGDITCDQARITAGRWKTEISEGNDPSADKRNRRHAKDMAEFCSRYLEDYASGRKKPASIRNDEQMISRFVLPALRSRKVVSVSPDDIMRLHNSLASTPYQANRLLALLSKSLIRK